MASRIDIYVSCSPEEALRRIVTGAPWLRLKDYFRLTPLKERCLAKVSGNTLLLRYLWPYLRNSYAPDGRGFVEPTAQGARIHVGFSTHWLVLLISLFWFGMLGMITIFMIAACLLNWAEVSGIDFLAFLLPVGLGALGAGGVYVCLRLGRKDEAAMIRFLNNLFADVKLPAPPSPKP
jgi:hypothetical protein